MRAISASERISFVTDDDRHIGTVWAINDQYELDFNGSVVTNAELRELLQQLYMYINTVTL